MIDFSQIRAVVGGDISDTDKLIESQLASEVPLVEEVASYLINKGGKRLRPLVCLLVANACGAENKDHITIATVVEFLHNATLLHDDVVDNSVLRRGQPSANQQWGNAATILVGDFLISRSLQLLVEIQSFPVLKAFADATNVIAEGEVMQLVFCKNLKVTQDQYLEVIRRKTAMMFETAARCGALVANAKPEVVDSLSKYALHLGVAFQMQDDILDYIGDPAVLGKNLGDDLAEGKVTLPLLLALEQAQGAEHEALVSKIKSENSDELSSLIATIRASGVLAKASELAAFEVDKAITYLECLPPSGYRDALEQLACLSISREH